MPAQLFEVVGGFGGGTVMDHDVVRAQVSDLAGQLLGRADPGGEVQPIGGRVIAGRVDVSIRGLIVEDAAAGCAKPGTLVERVDLGSSPIVIDDHQVAKGTLR